MLKLSLIPLCFSPYSYLFPLPFILFWGTLPSFSLTFLLENPTTFYTLLAPLSVSEKEEEIEAQKKTGAVIEGQWPGVSHSTGQA
jgi:hypothetical protein